MFIARKAYLNAIKYSYSRDTYSAEADTCEIKKVTGSVEKNLNCIDEQLTTIECNCAGGIVTGLVPDTSYTLLIRNKSNNSQLIYKLSNFHTVAKYNLKSDKITENSYEYQASVEKNKLTLQICRVCLVEGGSDKACCIDNYNTGKTYCSSNKYTDLKPGTVYDFIMCDTAGGQSIKKRFTTHITPRAFNITFSEEEVSYQLEYPDNNIPTGLCVGSFLGQNSAAVCKAETKCDCVEGTFTLPPDDTNSRFQLKLGKLIMLDYTSNGPGPQNPTYYTGILKAGRLTTSQYTITTKKGNMGEAICNFFTAESVEVKCQGEENVQITDCKCASGKLVGLTPNTEYKIKVILKSLGETILPSLTLKTAEIGKIIKESIGLNKYKYEIKYSDGTALKPDECRVCLEDRTTTTPCCSSSSSDYHTNSNYCDSYEFTVPETESKSLKFKMCDLDESVMINHDVDMLLAPTLNIILLSEDQIRYKLTYKDNKFPTSCKFFINDVEKSDLHCASNVPCDCVKGAFNYITENEKFKFTIKDMGGSELVSKELDKSKKAEYFQNIDEACSTFGI